MDQPTFADLEYDGKKRKTRREIFLERMDSLIPWDELEERIRPFYPKAGRGRRPYELSVMLRIHCVQLFYNLSDPGMRGHALRGRAARRFVGLSPVGSRCRTRRPILNFRHLLEELRVGALCSRRSTVSLESQGLRRAGTIVDASHRGASHRRRILLVIATLRWVDEEGERVALWDEWYTSVRTLGRE